MSKAYSILKKFYPLLPDSLRYRVDSYRLERRVRAVVKKLKHKSHIQTPTNCPELGLNVCGFLSAGLGLGEAVRSTIRGANAVGLPIYIHDIDLPTHPKDSSISFKHTNHGKFQINLFHFNLDPIEALMTEPIRFTYLKANYNIAFWFWETTELPKAWIRAAELFDEIWVGSSFCQSAVRAKISKPVTTIPLNVGKPVPDRSFGRRELGLPAKGFMFMTMVDCYSRPERKNPFGAIEAFKKGFDNDHGNVFLLVKVINREIDRTFSKILELAGQNKNIIIMDNFLNRSQFYSLINSMDCLVSLHRAEGFGLPIAEAMSMGKPVIATGWSANMDFMTSENSFPVSYDMMKLDTYARPYPKGTVWADPRIDEAADIMKKLVRNPELCREVGNRAREDIHTKFNAVVTGQKIVERLRQIREKT